MLKRENTGFSNVDMASKETQRQERGVYGFEEQTEKFMNLKSIMQMMKT